MFILAQRLNFVTPGPFFSWLPQWQTYDLYIKGKHQAILCALGLKMGTIRTGWSRTATVAVATSTLGDPPGESPVETPKGSFFLFPTGPQRTPKGPKGPILSVAGL